MRLEQRSEESILKNLCVMNARPRLTAQNYNWDVGRKARNRGGEPPISVAVLNKARQGKRLDAAMVAVSSTEN